jgi:CHAD domain-containing protein
MRRVREVARADSSAGATLLIAAIERRATAVEEAAARVAAGSTAAAHDDPEAIHDYRVALRRLRSVLRPLRRRWGRKRVEAIERELADEAAATGELRDEEVLRETLTELDCSAETAIALAAWARGRARREAGLRARAVRDATRARSEDGALGATLHALRALITSPPKRALDDEALARRALDEARRTIARRAAGARPDDGEAMHRLRIAMKRARYSAELGEELGLATTEPVRDGAARLQKSLGRLHDLDEARARMGRAYGLDRAARFELVARLERARDKLAKRLARSLDDDVATLLEACAAVHVAHGEEPPSVLLEEAPSVAGEASASVAGEEGRDPLPHADA